MRHKSNAGDFAISAAMLIAAIMVLAALMLWVQADLASGQALPPPVAATATPAATVVPPTPAPFGEWRVLLPVVRR